MKMKAATVGAAGAMEGGGVLPTEGLPGALGLVLRHRKWLVIGYLALLHFLVYFSMTHGVFTHPHHTGTAIQCPPPALISSAGM